MRQLYHYCAITVAVLFRYLQRLEVDDLPLSILYLPLVEHEQ